MHSSGPLEAASPLGWYNYARTYLSAAQYLANAADKRELSTSHEPEPANFLYSHAIELTLKGYLIANGITEDALRLEYRHKILKIWATAVELGLHNDPIGAAVCFQVQAFMMEARYLKPGLYTFPGFDLLDQVASGLLFELRKKLSDHDIPTHDVPAIRIRQSPLVEVITSDDPIASIAGGA